MTRRTTVLRELLKADGALMAAGAFGPMPAKLAEQAGFKAVYMPGGGIALNRLGVADVGLVTLTEMVDSAKAIAECSLRSGDCRCRYWLRQSVERAADRARIRACGRSPRFTSRTKYS